jgi:hypothetical protein
VTANPWDKFYWNDWETDPALKLCSLSAQGLWMRILCICAKADPKGYMLVAGHPLSPADLSSLVGKPVPEVETLLHELARYDVFSTDRIGRIYNRKMVRQVKKARTAHENGKKGGNPNLSNEREISPLDNLEDKPEVKPHKPKAISHSSTKNTALARFDEFWNACPKKTAKGAAERAWLKATSLAEPDVLIAAMRRYADTQSGKDAAFMKTPGPWLNEKRWLDEGIAPVVEDEEAESEARAAWGGDAAKLVDEIGLGAFKAYFEAVQFDSGPPVRMRVSKPFIREQIVRKFAAPLRRIYGEVILEAAA